jgi:hypothetical protein
MPTAASVRQEYQGQLMAAATTQILHLVKKEDSYT